MLSPCNAYRETRSTGEHADRRRLGSLNEAWKVRWWLGLLMAVLVGVIGLFSWMTVRRIQLDRLADEKAAS